MRNSRSFYRILLLVGGLFWLVACVSPPPTPSPPSPALNVKGELMVGASAETLASSCFGCHGPQGRSLAPAIPSLAGLSESYFINVMQAYQYGGRYGTVMGRIALAYDDPEIRRMARYFAAQKPQQRAQAVDSSQIGRARQLHQQYCGDCHGDQKIPPEPEAVTLHGQWQSYLRWTLQDYLVGINQTGDGMSASLIKLIRQEGAAGLEMLIQYYGSAHP